MFANKEEELFCQIGQELGYLTQEQVESALNEQKIDIATGVTKPIGGYLLEKNLLTREQIGQILKMQESLRSKLVSSNNSSSHPASRMYELVLAKCNKFHDGIITSITNNEKRRIFIAPRFNLVILETAISCFAREIKPEDVILHWDKTVMGGGEEGALITADSIYWKTNAMRPQHKLALKSIKFADPDIGFIYSEIILNKDKDLKITTGNAKFTEQTAKFLLDLAKL